MRVSHARFDEEGQAGACSLLYLNYREPACYQIQLLNLQPQIDGLLVRVAVAIPLGASAAITSAAAEMQHSP